MFDFCPGDCNKPVDVEAELFEELWSMQYRISGDKPGAKAFARIFLDRHAHELAEKIRTETDTLASFPSAGARGMATYGRSLADLIDPDVEETT